MDVISKEFSPGKVVDEIQNQIQRHYDIKNITLILEKQENFNSLLINSDRVLLRKILTQLVENALKYTHTGSITLGVSTNPEVLQFYIKDSGIGISEDALPAIFKHFSQEDVSAIRNHEGSGLGLAISKGLINLLGGTLAVDSGKGIGSTFTFTIPYLVAEITTSSNQIPALETLIFKRLIILVAEDEPYNFLLFELTLTKYFEIIRAEDGEEAVEICRCISDIELVLMDVKMPRMNGLMATQEIKKFRKDLLVIALTAYAEVGKHEKCLAAGCDDYLPKPVSKMELLNKIKELGLVFDEGQI